ncbi:hypothetical protein [Effusibacillus lacus]|uniref:Uncharacterized protein n=1 Tax=Effusibacillus lacus TaxID=1348429 RepID=A0A292YS48_9BACL|nr:hypothetical protein [Effusibacillus lacus]TCS76913.1 hypothetical protein EDD64_101137 [Effusibacillus lacus]GAX91244.1 hypothetical protein EFBL_2910 [Effusibacillus lacus]
METDRTELEELRFGADRASRIETWHQFLLCFERGARELCKQYRLVFPEEFFNRVGYVCGDEA